ncbi:MAG TPA: PxKF domain-containing protein [Pyrinomonadaceae bacterium]|nr:PxKF domain-containing protein [Pyrinomonadaceae bacterium]
MRDNSSLKKLTPAVDLRGGRFLSLLLPQGPPAAESIGTFAEDCTTPKTDFNFGETVCAVVSNAPLGANERLVWGHTDGFLARETMITSVTQNDSLLLTPTSVIGSLTVNNSGTWVISSIDVDGAPVATTKFTIHDPELITSDLSVYKFPETGESKVNENTAVRFTISVSNLGPDTATNVELADLTPDAATFVSLTQDSGPSFSCTDSNCTIASLPRGARANFTAIYHTNGVAAQTLTTYSASVTSDTNELRPADNSATGELSIITVGAPVACTLACPDNVNATANTTVNGERGAIVSFDAAEPEGDCGAVTATPASGSFFPVGTTTVTVNSATGGGSCSFTVTVEDTGTNPATISCSANVEVNAGANCEASVDLVDPSTGGDNVTVTGVRSDGKSLFDCDTNGNCTRKTVDEPFAAGITTITWTAYSHSSPGPFATAEDEEAARTGSASCTQTITVNDVTPPTISAAPQTIAADASCQAVVPDFTATATVSDNCACSGNDNSATCADQQPITVTQSPAPGTPVGLGTHTITLSANDGSSNNGGAGNTTTVTTTLTVADQTAPVVTAPADSSASADANCQVAIPDFVAGSTVSDSCDTNPTVTQSPAAGTLVGLGSHTVTVTATDAAGNQSSDQVVFTVNDTTAPVISCPSNIEVFLPPNTPDTSMAVTYPAATATDNCSAAPTVSYSHASGSTFPVGTTTVTVTATDAAGNHSECTFTVTVRYNFTGFFSPVNNTPTLNSVNAGRAIPVKFSLSGDKGLNIFAPNNPYSVSFNCNTNDPGVDVIETLTAGGSSLTFSGGQYIYVWKTESSWAGTCRQLVVTLNDGSVHVANFKFK